MEITDFGYFTCSNPDAVGIIFYANGDGQDWYEMRHGLTQWDPATGAYVNAVYGAWVTADAEGVVMNVEQDPSRLVPNNRTVLGIDADHWDIKPGMIWDGTQLLPPPPPTPETLQ